MIIQKLRGSNEKGFTLIELMIVIAIIGILAAIAIPNFLAYRTRGQDSAATSSAKNFYNMAMAYYADGHSGTLTTTEVTGFNPGADVKCGGSILDDGTGTITTPSALTFAHSASANTMTLDASGNVSK